jgi:hypothetical protein
MKNKNVFILLILMLMIIFSLFQISRNSDVGGMDENRNEVWDDVEAKIKDLGLSENMQNALFQLAVSFQKAVSDSNMNKEKALAISTVQDLALGCVYAIDKYQFWELKLLKIVEGWVINSDVKIRNYIHFNALLSGGVYQLPPAEKQSCNFKVND